MNKIPVDRTSPHNQFTIRSLLVTTAGVSVLFGFLSAGWYASAFWYLAASSVLMMGWGIVLRRDSRIWGIGLLLAGIGYAICNIVVLSVMASLDPFAIFHLGYIISAVLVVPLLVIITAIFVAISYRNFHWLSILGFVIWSGCVGRAHLWIIAVCSASV